ncbi:MAG: hydrogen peroxide-inducible genes activator, partial [Bacteroidales bacterium]|nr:hydrogen peroxide-inducible genes activator [Bacteroidales bacterium]
PFDLEGGSLETLMRIIRREGGFTVIPELTANELWESNAGNIARFWGAKPLREVSLCFSRNYVKYNLLQSFAETIKASVPQEMIDSKRGELVTWR